MAILIQLQTNLGFGDTTIRVNAADIALTLASPFLIVVLMNRRKPLFSILGRPLSSAILMATIFLTVSLWIGYRANGTITNWAFVKYAGWYALLVYLITGALTGLVANAAIHRRFVISFATFQAAVVVAYIVMVTLSIDTPLNFGPRLTGLAGNPNTMGFFLICGVALTFGYLAEGDLQARYAKYLLTLAAVITAGVLLTRSVAALIALAMLFGSALALKIVSLRVAVLTTVGAALVWAIPVMVDTVFDLRVTIFSKVVSLVSPNEGHPDNIEKITLADRLDSYRLAFDSWLAHPFLGEGLGTHLHEQVRRLGPDGDLVQIHSTLLWLLAETGVVGAGTMLAIFLILFFRIWQSDVGPRKGQARAEPIVNGVILVMISWAVMSLFHELMYQRVLWLLGGMALAVQFRALARNKAMAADDGQSGAAHEKPSIMYVIGSLRVGGSEMHLARITPRLVARGFAVDVYNFSGQGNLGAAMADQGVRVIEPPVSDPLTLAVPIRLLVLGLSVIKLFAVLVWVRPAIVHFFLPQTYIIGGILARIACLDRLVMSRRSLNRYQMQHPFLARIERRLHRHMTFILANSERVLRELRDQEAVPPEKSGLIYNGIDYTKFDEPFDEAGKRRELGIPDKAHVVTIVANLIGYKGHQDLLDAIVCERAALPKNLKLLLVGRDDGVGRDLKLAVEKLGLSDEVLFLGRRHDVAQILRLSHVGVLCSHEEGFSNAILEGMSAGLPMVVTDVGGNAEAVSDGETGIVVPARDPGALGAALVDLLGAPSRARKMGKAGRRRVEQLFSLENCVLQYESVYNDLATGQDTFRLSRAPTADQVQTLAD